MAAPVFSAIGPEGYARPETVWHFNAGLAQYAEAGDVLDKQRTDAFSITAWVRGDDAGMPCVLGKQAPAAAGWRFASNNATNIGFALIMDNGAGGVFRAGNNTSFVDGVERFVACTYTGSSTVAGVTLYINGASVSKTTTTPNNLSSGSTVNATNLRIGFSEVTSESGYIRHVAIWGRELTAPEIAQVYNAGSPSDLLALSFASDLQGWWKLDENDAIGSNNIIDSSAGGHNMTATAGLDSTLEQGSLEVEWPAHVADDLGILAVVGVGVAGSTSPQTISTPVGFSAISGANQLNDASVDGTLRVRTQAFRRLATTDSESPVTLDVPVSNALVSARIVTVTGCKTTGDPVDDVATDFLAGGTSINLANVTSTVDECLMIGLIGTVDNDATWSLLSSPGLDNETEEVNSQTTEDFPLGATMTIQTGEASVAGAIPAATVTTGSTSYASSISLLLIPPDLAQLDFETLEFIPEKDGYSNEVESSAIVIPLLGGPSRVRQDMYFGPHVVGVQWLFDREEYTNFMGYFRDNLLHGASPFLMDIITDIGIPTTHVCRCVNGMPRLTRQSGDAYWVAATIEAERNPTYTGLITYHEGGSIEFSCLNPTLTAPWSDGDILRIIDSKGIHPTGSTPINLDGFYSVDFTTGSDVINLDPVGDGFPDDWAVLAGLGVGVEYGNADNGNVISTITRVPTTVPSF